MRVCLVNPPHPYLKQPASQAPLGLIYVASSLRAEGVEVRFVDLSSRGLCDDFALPEADLYGVTGTALDRAGCSAVARWVRTTYASAKIVAGGPISLTPESVDKDVDAVVSGEGERIIFEVLRDFPNLRRRYSAERIMDLDSLPFPARDMLPSLGGNVFAGNRNYFGGGSTVIITSRGCPYSCTFCASPGLWGRKVVFRGIDNVLAEVDEIVDRYSVRQLRFSDDTLTIKRDRLQRLCAGLEKRSIAWRASVRVKPNDKDMFDEMFRAGCREVSFGVESFDDSVLDVLSKGTTAKDNRDAIVNAHRAGMVVRVLFMTGTPGETSKTTDINIRFLEELKDQYNTVALTNFIPIPGSAIDKDPGRFGCDVVCRDVDRFNFYMWGPGGLNVWDDFIRVHAMSPETQRDNKRRLREWVVASGKSNLG